MAETIFTTGELYELDLNLINILLTQAKHDKAAVARACKFVLEKLGEAK